jgi:L-threonylcarbamoyladenylate synthase
VVSRAIDLARLGAEQQPMLAAAIAAAGLVCFPTDTVYGIGGLATPATAAAIARAKGRAADKPLQVVYPTVDLLLADVPLPPVVARATRLLLPGPFTLVVPCPADRTFPPPGTAEWPADEDAREPGGAGPSFTVRTLGVRVPDWPRAARALAGLPFPLVASSANPSGGQDPLDLSDVEPGLRAACDLLLDAGPTGGVSSTVVDLSGLQAGRGFRILRSGAVGSAEIAAILAS